MIIDNYRTDPIQVGQSELNQDGLNAISDKTMPEIMRAAFNGTNSAYEDDDDRRQTSCYLIPASIPWAQLFQMLMLATVVEGRLIGMNPYGQPGVEQYKKHMKKTWECRPKQAARSCPKQQTT